MQAKQKKPIVHIKAIMFKCEERKDKEKASNKSTNKMQGFHKFIT